MMRLTVTVSMFKPDMSSIAVSLISHCLSKVKKYPTSSRKVCLSLKLTVHWSIEFTGDKGKPSVIAYYNNTKCGVNVVAQMAKIYTCKVTLRRWPVQLKVHTAQIYTVYTLHVYSILCIFYSNFFSGFLQTYWSMHLYFIQVWLVPKYLEKLLWHRLMKLVQLWNTTRNFHLLLLLLLLLMCKRDNVRL